jgi:hypothetical protein
MDERGCLLLDECNSDEPQQAENQRFSRAFELNAQKLVLFVLVGALVGPWWGY